MLWKAAVPRWVYSEYDAPLLQIPNLGTLEDIPDIFLKISVFGKHFFETGCCGEKGRQPTRLRKDEAKLESRELVSIRRLW